MTYATIFSGIGGWELGLNACGWQLRWQCEKDAFCQSVLRERFGVPICPDVILIYEWIQTIFGSLAAGKVDVLVCSPPCQPFSFGGLQRSVGDERHLFPIFANLVGKLEPKYILMEQVAAILSIDGGRAFGEYLGLLASLGYDATWHCIPACAVGAPHQRDRLWLVAYPSRDRWARAICGDVQDCLQTLWSLEKSSSALDSRVSLFDQFEHRVGAPAVFGVDDGIPHRSHRLKALGNAVVPQIPYLIGQAINAIELANDL